MTEALLQQQEQQQEQQEQPPLDPSLVSFIPCPNIFPYTSCSVDGSNHCIGITSQNTVYTWGNSNSMGQLGRPTRNRRDCQTPTIIATTTTATATTTATTTPTPVFRAYAGGNAESGHSLLVTTNDHQVHVSGCDRWQQLGLGSAAGGSAGYTWEGGRIWRQEFVPNHFITDLMTTTSGNHKIRDVALGGDHTIILSENQRDVYVFGKGGEGQLGIPGKSFVSAPVRSTVLSSTLNATTKTATAATATADIAAVCAIHNCSMTLNGNGVILKKTGNCRMEHEAIMKGLTACRDRAERDKLLVQGR